LSYHKSCQIFIHLTSLSKAHGTATNLSCNFALSACIEKTIESKTFISYNLSENSLSANLNQLVTIYECLKFNDFINFIITKKSFLIVTSHPIISSISVQFFLARSISFNTSFVVLFICLLFKSIQNLQPILQPYQTKITVFFPAKLSFTSIIGLNLKLSLFSIILIFQISFFLNGIISFSQLNSQYVS